MRHPVRHAAMGLAACLGLAACGQEFSPGAPQGPSTVALPPATVQGPRAVALLLPLTGPNAAVATVMQQAAQLAAASPGAPPLDIRDTGGDPARAADAARAAIAAGDPLILGPLTAEETTAVASVSVPANIPVLSFSSDPTVAAPGIWTLGLTPGQQLRRLVAAARDEGRKRIAALLPSGPFGDALETALNEAASDAGLDSPTIRRGGGSAESADQALQDLTGFQAHRADVESRIQAMRNSTDPSDREQAAVLAAEPPPPPPFDTLVLGANGDALRRLADLLPRYDVLAPTVRVLGPAFWHQAGHLGRLAGAWYAVPDPTQRNAFVDAYTAKYGLPPQPIADIAFDATLIGRSLAQDHDYSVNALTNADGFSGVDGALLLLPDGHVRRALAIYQITLSGGAKLVSPAPGDLSAPGS
jgi:ABC-type branched-subunit amino acid transport system substrate-binding protein